jgi:hypothetical protein
MLRRRDLLALMLSAPLAARAESDPDAATRAMERIDVGAKTSLYPAQNSTPPLKAPLTAGSTSPAKVG